MNGNPSSPSVSASSDSREKDEKKLEEQKAKEEAEKKRQEEQAEQQNNSYIVDGQWSIAANGMVFVRLDSGKYYSRVTNPNNYQYMTQIDADNAGYIRAPRGNQYARP